MPEKASLASEITPYIYGTTRLGHDDVAFEKRIDMALAAMDTGVWFHTSDQYDNALDVLKIAFAKERAKVPKLIVKLGWNNTDEIHQNAYKHIEPLGVENLEVGQLCMSEELAQDFANIGSCFDSFAKMKEEGLVKHFLVEIFPWTSQNPLEALRKGLPEGIIDGFIFYLNPLQRFAANELWDLLVERNETIIAMRTVSGGPVHRLRDVPGAAWKEYLQKRAVEVAPIFERSGIENWTEFCVRFAHSFPQVYATVGSTSRLENLQEFIAVSKNIKPLPQDIVDEITKLHYRWSDELDVHAEPWTM